jgi:hypothetical protein
MGSQLNYPILDRITPKLLERLGRTEKTERTEEGPRDSTCSICYEELVSEGESIDKCKNGYHDTCIKMWLKTKNNCPMCRSPWNFSICLSKLSIK